MAESARRDTRGLSVPTCPAAVRAIAGWTGEAAGAGADAALPGAAFPEAGAGSGAAAHLSVVWATMPGSAVLAAGAQAVSIPAPSPVVMNPVAVNPVTRRSPVKRDCLVKKGLVKSLVKKGSPVIGRSLPTRCGPVIRGAVRRRAAHPLRRVGREPGAAPPTVALSAGPTSVFPSVLPEPVGFLEPVGRGSGSGPAVLTESGNITVFITFTILRPFSFYTEKNPASLTPGAQNFTVPCPATLYTGFTLRQDAPAAVVETVHDVLRGSGSGRERKELWAGTGGGETLGSPAPEQSLY